MLVSLFPAISLLMLVSRWLPTTLALPSPEAQSTTINPTLAISTNDTALGEPVSECFSQEKLLPSKFQCHDAFQQFAGTLDPTRKYTIIRVGFPWKQSNIIVPKSYNSGTCKFHLTLTKMYPAVMVTGASLQGWGQTLLDKCVPDEASSSGGKLSVDLQLMGKVINFLVFEFKEKRSPMTSDDDDDDDSFAVALVPMDETTGGIVKGPTSSLVAS